MAKLDTIADALALPAARRDELAGVLGRCLLRWGRREIGEAPAYLSDITDDHTPFEFSLAFRGAHADDVDVRALVEAQPETPRIASRWQANEALLFALARAYSIDLARYEAIADVFRPTDEWARFAMWHAVNAGERTSFKLYLNPAAHGRHLASATVKDALARLGMERVWASVPALRRGFDEVKYFSIDLGDERGARVKVYFSHRNAPVQAIEAMMRALPGYSEGTATVFCAVLSGGKSVYETLPVQTCYAFQSGSDLPTDVALHFPVRAYAENDAVALTRVSELLHDAHRERYRRLVHAFAGRPLRSARAVQTYASFWARRGPNDVTVYLSPQLFTRDPSSASSTTSAPVTAAMRPRRERGER